MTFFGNGYIIVVLVVTIKVAVTVLVPLIVPLLLVVVVLQIINKEPPYQRPTKIVGIPKIGISFSIECMYRILLVISFSFVG